MGKEKYARGRSSEIFRLEDGKVLKLFFKEYPESDVTREFENTKIVSKAGCTPIKVFEMVEKDDKHGFTMSFAEGITQNERPEKNPFYLFKGGKDLARCHALVHSKEAPELVDIRKMAVLMLENAPFDEFSKEEKAKIKEYIEALPNSDTIIHLDFHTGNVLVDKKGNLTIIDWMTAARGHRAIEYAMMEFLFSEAELFPEASKAQLRFYSAVRKMIGKQYYKTYQKLMPLDKSEVDKYRLVALVVRRNWNIDFEKDNLINKIRNIISKV